MNYKLDIELSPELEPYRAAIEATIQPYIRIKLTENDSPKLWQSKFGGLPYLPKDFEYPKSNDGEYLHLLAQINFAEVPSIDSLPKKGILQFYLANDEGYGFDFKYPWDFKQLTKQDKFRVIYFAEIDKQNLVTDFSFLPSVDNDNFPINGCCVLEFDLDHEPISVNDYRFDILPPYEGEAQKLYNEYQDRFGEGHKLLGYPDWEQDDPRTYCSPAQEPYILLLQIDSDTDLSNIDIEWGDFGIGSFLIQQSALEKLDFSTVVYNWDCG